MKNDRKSAAAPRRQKRPKAATGDVLSPPPAPVKINRKWAAHYRHLVGLRDYFLRQKGALSQDANEEQPTFSEHMADAGTDSYDRDFALSMLTADQNALYEIEEAMRRIEAGTYGICELTGKPISGKRLDAIPWARYSLEAEKQLEQRGVVNRPRLGNLGTLAGTAPPEEEDADNETGNNG